MDLCRKLDTRDVLDYGCGKKTLEKALGFPIANYDPCIDALSATPAPHAIVACTDVLEHIEPECLDAVLDDLKRCTLKVAVLVIATRPAKKFLADGRNAHLIQERPWWWLDKIYERWELRAYQNLGGEFLAVCDALPAQSGLGTAGGGRCMQQAEGGCA